MARKSNPIRCVLMIPDGHGGNQSADSLPAGQVEQFFSVCAERIGTILNSYVCEHPEVLR